MGNRITKDAKEILAGLARYRVLTVRQISALHQRSCQVIRRRLRIMEAGGLAETHPTYGKNRGRPPELIFITQAGVKLLEQEKILKAGSFRPILENWKTSGFIDHELLVNWFRIHLVHMSRLISEITVRYLERTQDLTAPSEEEGTPFIPDGLFSIKKEASGQVLIFFLEIDRGTEPLASKTRRTSDIRQKILNYQSLLQEGQYRRFERVFGSTLRGFRVLFLADTPADSSESGRNP